MSPNPGFLFILFSTYCGWASPSIDMNILPSQIRIASWLTFLQIRKRKKEKYHSLRKKVVSTEYRWETFCRIAPYFCFSQSHCMQVLDSCGFQWFHFHSSVFLKRSPNTHVKCKKNLNWSLSKNLLQVVPGTQNYLSI